MDSEYLERQFRVGDRCRIRQWDDMAAEFGYEPRCDDDYDDEEEEDEDGDVIQCEFSFTTPMRRLCGHIFTVSEARDGFYHSVEGIECSEEYGYWSISADMLEYDYEVDDILENQQAVAGIFELIDML